MRLHHMSTTQTATDWTRVPHDTEVKVTDAKGRFYFHGVNGDGSICVYGGASIPMFRSFTPDRCRVIHRRTKADPAWKVEGVGAPPNRRTRR